MGKYKFVSRHEVPEFKPKKRAKVLTFSEEEDEPAPAPAPLRPVARARPKQKQRPGRHAKELARLKGMAGPTLLRKWAEANDTSIGHLANRLDVPFRRIERWTRGETRPAILDLLSLHKITGIDPSAWLSEVEQKSLSSLNPLRRMA